MNLGFKIKNQFILFYLICFIVNYLWLFSNSLLLSSLNPIFFVNELDFTKNIVMLTNLHHFIIKEQWLALVFDLLYIALPVLLTFATLKNHKAVQFIAFATSIFSLVYFSLLSSYTFISVHACIGWVFVPLIFSAKTNEGLYFYFNSARYYFILIIASSAIWKIRLGGVFNPEQMSGILLHQHKHYLAAFNSDWFTNLNFFLVRNSSISYFLYLAAFFIELIFLIELFTKRYDRLLVILLFLFIVFDLLIMQIFYFTWLGFAGFFYFSRFIKINTEAYK
ncbi:MAG: hypothetical protein M3413_12310 [Bacteroidota bacterium]|nr:hypothetical protein [Bacteroidota bacterium]